MNAAVEPYVGVVLVNYNGWQDTIECLESLLKLEYTNFKIVITDNASTDNSIHYIKEWASGNLDCNFNQSAISKQMAYPPSQKPIILTIITEETEEKHLVQHNHFITVITSAQNLGFAGGNNVASNYLFSLDVKPDYIWYLNNDTVADKYALSAAVGCFEQSISKTNKLGIVGSKLRYYDKPQTIQAIGAQFNPWFATAKHVGCNEEDKGQYDANPEFQEIDYIVGASMLVSRSYLLEVGFMSEEYFLYFEEIDWVKRGKKEGYKISYCPTSVVYHKEGAAIGANAEKKIKSKLSDFYDLRNRIKFTRKNNIWYLPVVYASMAGVMANRIRRGQFGRVSMILKVLLGKSKF